MIYVRYIGKNIIQHGSKKGSKLTEKLLELCDLHSHKIFFIDEEGGLFNRTEDWRAKSFIGRHPINILPSGLSLIHISEPTRPY